MGIKKNTIDIIVEFISPYDDELNILILGDNFTRIQINEIKTAFNNVRIQFDEHPFIVNNILKKQTPLNKLKFHIHKTNKIFKGSIEEITKKEKCIIVLDRELSKYVIDILTNNEKDIDELDLMLINKYIFEIFQDRFILDITDCDTDKLILFTEGMDVRSSEFNYLGIDNYMALHIIEDLIKKI